MSVHEWWVRLRGSARLREIERDMDAEMRFHVEMATERNLRAGMSASEARRRALLTFGSDEAYREEGRSALRARLLETIAADIRYGVRSLRRAPSFTIASVLTMALGIAATTAVFTVVNAVLLRPLPLPAPDDVAYAGWQWANGSEVPSLTGAQYEYLRDNSRTLEAVATYRTQEAYVGLDRDVAPARGLRVSEEFFAASGIMPVAGRAFDAAESAPGGPAVVILSDELWRNRFGADPRIVGRSIHVNGEAHAVVGVMPPSWRFPAAPEHTAYLVPLRLQVDPQDEGHNLMVITRAVSGSTPRQRAAEASALGGSFNLAHPQVAEPGATFRMHSHADVFAADIRTTLWVLLGAVGLLLLIACTNTATLLLVRAMGRQREIAVRSSLGAHRGRVVQQLVTEGMLLAVVSTLIGAALGAAAVRVFLAAAPAALPGAQLGPDARVIAFAAAITAFCGIIFGLVSALPAFRLRLQPVLLGRSLGASRSGARIRETLVFAETAIAVVLLVGAALLATSFVRLMRVDPGFETANVVVARLGRMPPDYTPDSREELADRVVERLRQQPLVHAAAAASSLPLERGMNFPADIAEAPDLAIGAVELRFVTPDYLDALGVTLRAGRDFAAADVDGSEPVAIVNEAFARHFWQDAAPVGRLIQIGHYRDRWLRPGLERQTRVIGVIPDVREIGLDREPKPTVLVPRTQMADGAPVLIVRGAQVADLMRAVAGAIEQEDSRLVPEVESMQTVVGRSVTAPRFRTMIIGVFAGSAVLLAAIGIYGVVASGVQQRRREFGLRLVLGASRSSIMKAAVRRSVVVVACGALAGLVASLALGRLVESMLYGTSTTEPVTLALSAVVLTGVAGIAAYLPARRAANLDPAISMRSE